MHLPDVSPSIPPTLTHPLLHHLLGVYLIPTQHTRLFNTCDIVLPLTTLLTFIIKPIDPQSTDHISATFSFFPLLQLLFLYATKPFHSLAATTVTDLRFEHAAAALIDSASKWVATHLTADRSSLNLALALRQPPPPIFSLEHDNISNYMSKSQP